MLIPDSHPRAESLRVREKLVEGFRNGLVVEEGLIAHGRGETFDYLIGEQTIEHTSRAMRSAVALMLAAGRLAISVNGNTACLCAREVVELARLASARIEVNLFYRTPEREAAIEQVLRTSGAEKIYGVGRRASKTIPELMSERRRVDPDGIYAADVVLVPLEDGDRTEALVRMGKKVIAIDLNPLSRTARSATITVVDNIVRAMPKMVELAGAMSKMRKAELEDIANNFDNAQNLEGVLEHILMRAGTSTG